MWQGAGGLGPEDGRIAFYLTDHVAHLAVQTAPVEGDLEAKIRDALTLRNAVFFDDLSCGIGGFRNELVEALWRMVWAGEVINDTLMPLRCLRQQKHSARNKLSRSRRAFRSRRTALEPGTEGRWSLFGGALRDAASVTEQQIAHATQLIERYGVLTREMVSSEGFEGGFSRIYPAYEALEESGRIRRGYFVNGLRAAQFAAPGAEDRIRETAPAQDGVDGPHPIVLAAKDLANPYGAALPWHERPDSARPARGAGARVILLSGHLIGYLNRSSDQLLTFLPTDEPERSLAQAAVIQAVGSLATDRTPAFLSTIDRLAPESTSFAKPLQAAGFVSTSRGLLHRRRGD